LSFFFWPLCCLSFFYLLILITRLQTLLKNRLVLFVYKSTINVLRFWWNYVLCLTCIFATFLNS
jgi:hypothetical protein